MMPSPSTENRATARYPSLLKKAEQITVTKNEQWNNVTLVGPTHTLSRPDHHTTRRDRPNLDVTQRHVAGGDGQRESSIFDKQIDPSSSIRDHTTARDNFASIKRALEAIQRKDEQRRKVTSVKSMRASSSIGTRAAAARPSILKKTQPTTMGRDRQWNNDYVPDSAKTFATSVAPKSRVHTFIARSKRSVISFSKPASLVDLSVAIVDSRYYRSKDARGRSRNRARATSPVHYRDTSSTRSQSPAHSFYHDDSADQTLLPIRGQFPAPIHNKASASSDKACNCSTSSFVEPDSARVDRTRAWRPCQTLENTSGYQYTPLLDDEIRLLRLSPGSFGDPLSCSLKIVPMEKLTTTLHEFQALSYAWGNDPPSYPVSLDDLPKSGECSSTAASTQSYTYLVRENLQQALRHIRLADDYLWIWVDALCLNQDDQIEKGRQILKMPDIYSNAWNVIAWLGGDQESPKDIRRAVGLVPKILNLKTLNVALRRETPSEEILRSWVAFGRLLQRPWFKRRWVIQEVACARKLCVRTADQILSWLDFADAVELYSDNINRMRALYRQSSLFKLDPVALDGIECSQAVALMTFSRNIFRKSSNSLIVSRLRNLESLVLAASAFAVSDIRDVVYALLYLANDSYRSIITRLKSPARQIFSSDYSKHPAEIFEIFVRYSIAESGSLDILCRPWANWPSAARDMDYEGRTLPSWIGVALFDQDGPHPRHIPPEDLLGPVGGRVYDASRGMAMQTHTTSSWKRTRTPPTLSSSDGDSDDSYLIIKPPLLRMRLTNDNVLHVKGMILGRITTVSVTTASEGFLKDDWLRTLGWQGTLEKGVDDELWRTLVANRNPDSKAAPTWYRRACALALTKLDHAGNLDITALTADSSQPATLVNYLRRVQEATANRRSFRCRTSGTRLSPTGAETDVIVGFGPEHISSKDHVLVCILYGSSVPVILNKIEHRVWGTTHVKLIGACYVHGHMDGEIFAGLSEEDIHIKSTTFSIH